MKYKPEIFWEPRCVALMGYIFKGQGKELPGLAFFGREGRRLGRKESIWGNPRVRRESRFHHKQIFAYIE